MNTRRIATTVGLAAGGALAATFFSTGIAAADDDGGAADPVANAFGFTPTGENTDVDTYGGLLPFFQSAAGTQEFDFDSGNLDADITPLLAGLPWGEDGTELSDVNFNVIDSSDMLGLGLENQSMYLPDDLTVNAGTDDEFTLEQGSALDVANFGGGWGNVYTNFNVDGVEGIDADTSQIHDTLITPFGNFDISDWVNALDFNPAEVFDDPTAFDPSDGLIDASTDVGGGSGEAAADGVFGLF
jgi:hypothetical protein